MFYRLIALALLLLIPPALGTLQSNAQAAFGKVRVVKLDGFECHTQPETIIITRHYTDAQGQPATAQILAGTVDSCYWELEGGMGELWTDNPGAFALGYTSRAPGGFGDGWHDGMSVVGTYTDGSVVAEYNP